MSRNSSPRLISIACTFRAAEAHDKGAGTVCVVRDRLLRYSIERWLGAS